jgi:16S rRNA (guanine1207-N2)-methyltransferase
MSHYFINDDSLDKTATRINYNFCGLDFIFETHSGVFSKNEVDYATSLLLNTVSPKINDRVQRKLLDLGCGYGCIGIALAKFCERAGNPLILIQSDVNKAAVELTRRNCELNGVESNVIESDCFDSITGKFDVITLNPPIHAGKSTTYKMYEQAFEHLQVGGRLFVVTLKKHGAMSTFEKLKEVFGEYNCMIVYKKSGYFVFEAFSE